MCSKGMELHKNLINAERSLHHVTCSKVVRFLVLNLQNTGMLAQNCNPSTWEEGKVHATSSIHAHLQREQLEKANKTSNL